MSPVLPVSADGAPLPVHQANVELLPPPSNPPAILVTRFVTCERLTNVCHAVPLWKYMLLESVSNTIKPFAGLVTPVLCDCDKYGSFTPLADPDISRMEFVSGLLVPRPMRPSIIRPPVGAVNDE